MYRTILSSLTGLVGALIFIGGVWLAFIGGSWFFIVLGVALCASAFLLFKRRPGGLALYGVIILVTFVWAVYEVGFDWWALSARGSLLMVIGALLLLPPMVRSLHQPQIGRARYDASSGILAGSMAIALVAGIYAMFQSPHDTGGVFSDAQMTANTNVATNVPDGEWHAYGRTDAGRRYSPLDQITPANVGNLKVAWTYHTGDIRGPNDPGEATYEDTPLMVDGTVFVCTPHNLVIALDAVSGNEKWRFDPHLKQTAKQTTQHLTCRGVSYFDGTSTKPAPIGQQPAVTADSTTKTEEQRVEESAAEVTTGAAGVPQNVVTGQAKRGDPNPIVDHKTTSAIVNPDPTCIKRLFAPTSDGRLISISAATGKICPGFGGDDGTINLWAN